MFPLEFRAEVNRQETRVMGLSYSEDRMIVDGVVLACYRTVTDGQTDGRTVRQNLTALCIASYADALSKKTQYKSQKYTHKHNTNQRKQTTKHTAETKLPTKF